MSESRIAAIVIARREAIKLVMAGAAASPLIGCGTEEVPAKKTGRTLTDPDLVNPVVPWDAILTAAEMRTVTALCDVILPEDDVSPSASAVGVPEFINEWVSAPYPDQERDLRTVRDGLVWLNTESDKRYGSAFHTLEESERVAICEDIHHQPDAATKFRQAAAFFNRFRWLTLCGFYTTEAGRKDVGYIGNVPLNEFPGATPEQLRYLGLEG
jgi:hypothetical protein